MKKIHAYIFFLLLSMSNESCKKLVQVDAPSSQLASSNVYSSNATATSVLTGLYSNMSNLGNARLGLVGYLGYITGLSADELTYYGNSVSESQYYSNSLLNKTNLYFWSEFYQQYIYTCNDVLTNLPNSSVSPQVSDQLIGEAKFIRAFLNFYLTNMWGDIPLLTSTNYSINGVIARSSVTQVYDLIKQDLLDAQRLLNVNYVGPDALTTSTERTIPNQWAATAMLARVYLYLGDWKDAETQATAVISNSTVYGLKTSLDSVFLANNREAIWQIQPLELTASYDTYDAYRYVMLGAPGTVVSMSPFLLHAFEPGDSRRTHWVHDTVFNSIPYSYAFKYKIIPNTTSRAEYTTMLRLAEQYLIRSEARAQQENSTDAIADLNVIRARAGLSPYAGATDKNSILAAILHERQVELFTEFGHRWFDLKRTKAIDTVMGAPGNVCQAKGGTWKSDWQLYPIPLSEIQMDKHLTQNDGY